jgi:hypothetical protein
MAGDARRIFLGGRSAGGHLASLLAVRRDWQAVHGLPEDVLRGCISVSGVCLLGEASVSAPDIGGGFGMKGTVCPEDALVVWAAGKSGRPVKWTAERPIPGRPQRA